MPLVGEDARRGRNEGILRQPSSIRLRPTAAAECIISILDAPGGESCIR